jgi:hypothetical protein
VCHHCHHVTTVTTVSTAITARCKSVVVDRLLGAKVKSVAKVRDTLRKKQKFSQNQEKPTGFTS